MTENKNDKNAQALLGLLILVLIGGAFFMDVMDNAQSNTRAHAQPSKQLNHGSQGDVHPSSSNIVSTGRDYIFTGGYVASTRGELRNLDNLIGNTEALMNRVNSSPYVTTISEPTRVTVVQRAGGVTSPMHVLIQLDDGRQVWTLPEFLEPVRQ